MSVIIKRVWNQNKMVNIESLHGMAFQAEDGGHVFEISGVNDAGEAVPLSGTVAGVFMRSDRADIALIGEASGGVASVTLTDDCYAVPGRFGLTIFVTEGGKKTAVYAAVGTVSTTSGGGVAGETPQDVVDLINAIAAAVATIPPSYTALMAAIAPTYSDQAVYPAGSYRWHGGALYTNPNIIDTPESWTAAHWTTVDLAGEVSDLKNALGFSLNLKYNPADMLISDNTDLDTLITPGNYGVSTTASAETMVHGPTAITGYRLLVMQTVNTDRLVQIAVLNYRNSTLMYRVKDSNSGWNSWQTIANDSDISSIRKSVSDIDSEIEFYKFADYTGAFTSGRQQVVTSIVLKKDHTYIVVANKPFTKTTYVWGHGDSDHYKAITPWCNVAVLPITGLDRYFDLYNVNQQLDDIDVSIYEIGDRTHNYKNVVPKVFYVNKDSRSGQYTSLTQCLLDLKDDETEKVIYIDGGDYDIYQEYVDSNVPVYTGNNPAEDYWDYCVWIPKNTHIIGRGLVRLKWMPTLADNPEITVAQCRTVSPINVAGSMTLENVEVWCKNGRYCVHDDPLKQEKYTNAVKKFINVKFYKEPNETVGGASLGFNHIIGFGANRSMHYEYENCEFHNSIANGWAFYGHTEASVGGQTLTEAMSSDFVIKNCVMVTENSVTVSLQNVNSDYLHCRVFFANCYFSGSLELVSTSAQQPGRRNAYDLTLVKCGTPTITVADPNNEYPPKVYN